MIPATTSDGFLLALESKKRRSGQWHHLSATILELEGRMDPASLRAAADALAKRHPLLNARITRGKDFIARWIPGDPLPCPLETSDRDESSDPARDARTFIEASKIDILKDGPNLELVALQYGPDSWRLILVWPHALFDAIGINKLISELDNLSTDRREDWGETSKTEGSPGGLWSEAKPMVEEMRTFPAWPIRSLHDKTRSPSDPRFEVFNFDRETSARIRTKMAGTAGELLMLPYFASCAARAVHAVICRRHPDEEAPILLSLPVQRIANPAKRPLFQNHMVAYSLLMEPAELRNLGTASKALYRKYADFMRRKLPAAMEALMKLMERCPSFLYLKPASFYLKGEICSLFHSHTGEFAPGVSELFGSRLLNGYHVPTVSSPPGIGIFFSEFDGQLSCTISTLNGTLTPDERDLLVGTLLEDLGIEAATPEATAPPQACEPVHGS
ncbi:condensation domain-containing protein [Haloferula helveola]|uniref:Condensation domain-containing protein n=1 Tax=Haloferula helveola TaxID=490095 RepID=A0ABN6H5G4_9BACT|nr:condensation domain-containing protein [Haloferula helveola]